MVFQEAQICMKHIDIGTHNILFKTKHIKFYVHNIIVPDLSLKLTAAMLQLHLL